MERVDRRTVLKGLASLAMLAATPMRGLAQTLGGIATPGAARASLLLPDSGLFVIHTDLHNHTHISGDTYRDANGVAPSPYAAYQQMRDSGLDAVSLTEHAISGKYHGEITCGDHDLPCRTITGINATDWAEVRRVSDEHDVPHEFVSVTGFEWSTPTVGHINVWFSEQFTDSLEQRAFFTPRAAREIDRIGFPSELAEPFQTAPDIATVDGFYEWLSSAPDRLLFGGGADGIGCFNHPNQFGDFEAFKYHPGAAQKVVSFEALNLDRDFFWNLEYAGLEYPNPFDACLEAGWRVGFTGVSDEHGEPYGRPGRARGGLWVDEVTRAGVRRALEARRSFATFEPGLRLDALCDGVPMGGVVDYAGGGLSIDLDLDAGGAIDGDLIIEVIARGPEIAHVESVSLPASGPFSFAIPPIDGGWFFLRITDPTRPPHPRATGAYAEHGGVVAYASPFFLDR